MGILVKHPVSALSDKAFHRLDYHVMAMAFELYNSIGNLWDENDYKAKLVEHCFNGGLEAIAEAPVTVVHKEFRKPYFIDLLIEGVVYELKTTASIATPHESQTLNYLFLTNTQHGKIINFRPDSLEWRFVSTSLSFDQRKSYTLKAHNWIADGRVSENLPELLAELLNDWGAYLEIQLYKEAMLFFMGQSSDDMHKRFCPLSPETLIHFTGLTRKKAAYQKNIQKYLTASSYQRIDWVNFDGSQIELCSLTKK